MTLEELEEKYNLPNSYLKDRIDHYNLINLTYSDENPDLCLEPDLLLDIISELTSLRSLTIIATTFSIIDLSFLTNLKKLNKLKGQ